MTSYRIALLLVLLPSGALDYRAANGEQRATNDERQSTLWYRKPAGTWNEALPIGSGRLAAMVFGGVDEEHLQLNEETVWAGERRDRVNPAGRAAVPEVRRL